MGQNSIRATDGSSTSEWADITRTDTGSKKALDINIASSDVALGGGGSSNKYGITDPLRAFDDTTTANVIYLGYSAEGTLSSAASWAIVKVDISGTGVPELLADGDILSNNIWDNRASLSYS